MAHYKDTQEMLALRYPNCKPFIDEIEAAALAARTERGGYGRVEFVMQGIDRCGKLIVKAVKLGLLFPRHYRDDEDDTVA